MITRSFKISAIILLFVVLLSAICFLYIEEQGNFHPITYGEAYRSAQLDADELEHYIKKYNIQSMVNLRGKNPEASWYREEMNISAALNIKHYDISLSSSREPSGEDISRIIEIFKSAPRPVLIHCQAGADRSGLAAAIWKVIVDKERKSEADKQLSIFYGHLPIGKTTAMDRFFNKWNPVLN